MKCFKRTLICVLCVSILACVISGCGNQAVLQKQIKYAELDNYNIISDCVVADNEEYILNWNSEFGCVSLLNKKNGYTWSTTPTDANDNGVDEFGFPILAPPVVNSPIIIQYLNPSTLTPEIAYAYSSSITQRTFNCELIKNGLKVTYYFNDEQIAIPVNYILRDDNLLVSVDTKEIRQGKYKLFSVSMAPYLCYTKNDSADSYLFVPSGCGALIYPKNLSQTGTKYSEPVYGEDMSMQVYDAISTTENILLPIYGCSNNNMGVLSIIEDSAESAYIEGSIGSDNTGYSNIGATFYLRGYDSLIAKTATNKVKSTLYADSLISGNISIGIYPLSDSDANFNGMINKYRDHLIETKQLSDSSNDSTQLHIKVFGGQLVKDFFFGVPYKRIFCLTSLSDVSDIISEINEMTDEDFSVELCGFGKTGLTKGELAGGYAISDVLGSKKQLKEIQKLCDSKNCKLYFDYDLISFCKSGNGWSYYSDLATGPTGLSTYQYQYYLSTRSRNSSYKKVGLLSRSKIKDSGVKLVEEINDWGIKGIGVERLGSTCYSDYSDLEYFVKGKTVADVQGTLKELKKNNYGLLANTANVYAACHVDEITDVPLQSGKSDVFDIDIPAYQMLFCGYKSMTSAAINNCVDPIESMLKAIECGCGLSYSIISNYDSSLISYTANDLHSSVYADVRDDIDFVTKKTKDFYKAIKGAKIVEIQLLSNNLHKTVFNNGVTVYVNYGEDPVQIETGQVASRDYLMEVSS